MTPEKLHEAIGLLASDLVAEADAGRNQLPKKKKSHWKQFAAMAACFAVVLACGLFLTSLGMGGSSKGTSMEMAAEAPAAPAPTMAQSDRSAAGEVLDEAAPAEEEFRNPVTGGCPIEPGAASVTSDAAAPMDFALRLLQSTHTEDKNTLVSPLSVFSALAMTANGADGSTLAQMETVLGMAQEDMGTWLDSYLTDQGRELKLANAIWFTDDDRLTVQPGFVEDSRNTYRAEVNRAPMNRDTCDAINRWVREKTDGMIPAILEEIPGDAVMYLVNALAFEAQWLEPYEEFQVTSSTFTTQDGQEQDVNLMRSTEHVYYEDDCATGFRKSYDGARYAFVALMPKEGVTVEEYLGNLTGEHLTSLLENPTATTVYAALPKFETEFSTELSDSLKAMGMTDAFDMASADFSAMGTCEDGNLFINRVKHKTHLSVAEQGTRAGAATVVEMVCGAALIQDTKTVTLDRPFLYMIVDGWYNYPIFIGTMMDMES